MREFPRLWVPPPAKQFWVYNKTNGFLSRGTPASCSHVTPTSSTPITSTRPRIVPLWPFILFSGLSHARGSLFRSKCCILSLFQPSWESGIRFRIRCCSVVSKHARPYFKINNSQNPILEHLPHSSWKSTSIFASTLILLENCSL